MQDHMYDLQVKQISVEPIYKRVAGVMPQHELELLQRGKLEGRIDEMVRAMVLELSLDIDRTAAEVVTLEVKVPATWWEHFKERFFPNWLAKRYPVVYTCRSQSVQKYYLCPHGATGPKNYRKHLSFLAGEPNAVLSPPQSQPLQSPRRCPGPESDGEEGQSPRAIRRRSHGSR